MYLTQPVLFTFHKMSAYDTLYKYLIINKIELIEHFINCILKLPLYIFIISSDIYRNERTQQQARSSSNQQVRFEGVCI